jgi:osmoprotectant transport system ATP-binding protein
VLEQEGAPADVLADPANDFVRAFLGAERGLKRLSLLPVSSAPVAPGPTVAPGDDRAHARRVMADSATDWAAVVDDGVLRGWVGTADLDGHGRVADVAAHAFAVTVTPTSSLREALDTLVGSPTNVAAVVDPAGRYLGILDVAAISAGLHR